MSTVHDHWMMKEIVEQPLALQATLDHYLGPHGFRGERCDPLRDWLAAPEIVIAASGSSRHAGQVGELLIEDRSGIPVDVEYASEYNYRSKRAQKHAALLVISQSGETADTLAALRKAGEAGQPTMAITNVAGSTMAREADVSFSTLAGPERAIPATKSFTTQLLNLYLLSLLAAESRGTVDAASLADHMANVRALPQLIEAQLPGWHDTVARIVPSLSTASSFLYIGRGVHYPVAREGALKLKESAYLHAEGYPSGELKHGPNALLAPDTPLIVLATRDSRDPGSAERYARVLQLMRDLDRQGARMIAIANGGDRDIEALTPEVIRVAETEEALLPVCEVIPLQMLACQIAVARGIDVDHPRNLSKAVLTE